MKYSELKRSLANGVNSVYLLCGTDDFLRNYAITLIDDRCLSVPEINFLSVSGENITQETLDTVFNSLQSCPFLSERRVVVIKEYYPTADDLKKSAIGGYLKDPVNTSVFIISNKKQSKNLEKFDTITVVDCNSEMTLCVAWICSEAKKAGVSIVPAVAGKIAEYSLLDFTKINSEMSKLIDYCADSGVIDINAVNEIVHEDSEYQIYEMVECIASGKRDEAYAILCDLLSKNESEQKLFISVYSYFRRMLHIAVSDAKNSEIAENLGIKEYAVKMTKNQLRKFPIKRIKTICEKFSEYDVNFKKGETNLSAVLWNGLFTAMITD